MMYARDRRDTVCCLRYRSLASTDPMSGRLANSISCARRYSCNDRPDRAARAASSSRALSGTSRMVIEVAMQLLCCDCMHNASTRRYPLRRRSSPRLEHEGDRVTSVESGSGGESMFEHLAIELLRDSLEQLGLGTPHRWPGPQSGKLPQPVGRTQGHRCPPCIPFPERELGGRDE